LSARKIGGRFRERRIDRMDMPLLSTTVIVFGLAIAVLLACYRLKIPTIVGFLLTGILAGPGGFGLVSNQQVVETLAQIGVVILLFSIGLEFSMQNLLQLRKTVFLGGPVQVLATIAAVTAVSLLAGRAPPQSVFMGLLLSLSSTAIVLKWYQERAEVESPHGRTSLGILVFQDLAVVPMMLLLPVISGASVNLGPSIAMLLIKVGGTLVCMFVLTRWVVPKALFWVAKTRSRELFILAIIVICFSVAWLTSSMGLSLALGAFLAGLILSESEYAYQALGSILPLRDVFTSVFFISIGMLFDMAFFLRHPALIIALALAVFAGKSIIAFFVPALLGLPLRTMALTGLALGQVGEFAFILSRAGLDCGLLDGNSYQIFLGVSILTMAATPFVMAVGPKIADALLRLPLPSRIRTGLDTSDAHANASGPPPLSDHLIIVGFGVNGRNVARAARASGVPYAVTDMNPETVRKEKKNGEPIFFGDATQDAILQHVNIAQARVVVVGIPDAVATRRVVETARKLNPTVHILARTRSFFETKSLYALGASEVVPEEFETSVEIFARVLVKYQVPRDQINQFIAEIRQDGYQMLRGSSDEKTTVTDLKFAVPDVEVNMVWVGEGSFLAGKTIAGLNLRRAYGITLLAVRRGAEIISNPDGDEGIWEGDILVFLGKPEDNGRFMEAMRGNKETSTG
jgi:monovalent cation:H+ antiporter-2, CPA2 family